MRLGVSASSRLRRHETRQSGKPKTITFSAALLIFGEQQYPALKPRTVHDYKAIFRRHFSNKLGDLRLADSSFEDVTDKLVKTRSEQRHARWAIPSSAGAFAGASSSTVRLMGSIIPKPKKRKRVLSDAELVKVYRAAEGIG